MAAILLPLIAGCGGASIRWYPQRAKYKDLTRIADTAVALYAGDHAEFHRCESLWIGDLICHPSCSSKGTTRVGVWAARRGATHIELVQARAEQSGTETNSTSFAKGPIAIGSSETHATYSEWEEYRMYRVEPAEQLRCLERELRYEEP